MSQQRCKFCPNMSVKHGLCPICVLRCSSTGDCYCGCNNPFAETRIADVTCNIKYEESDHAVIWLVWNRASGDLVEKHFLFIP